MNLSSKTILSVYLSALIFSIILIITLPEKSQFLAVLGWMVVGFFVNGIILGIRGFRLSQYLIKFHELKLKEYWINYYKYGFRSYVNFKELLSKNELVDLLGLQIGDEAKNIILHQRLFFLAFLLGILLFLLSVVS